jgi:Domain of unknown function (DUF222)
MAVLEVAHDTVSDRAAVVLDRLEQYPVGASLYAGLRELESIPLGAAAAVRAAALWAKLGAHCQARGMIPIAEAVRGAAEIVAGTGHDVRQVVGEELAAMTHVSSGAGIDQVCLVGQIGDTLPLSWEALDRGDLTVDHVRKLARVTRGCSPRVATLVDARLIPVAIARGWTPGELHSAAMKAVIELDPDGAAERAATAKLAADVRLHASEHETALLEAHGDAVTLRAVMDRIEAHAKTLAATYQDLPAGLARFNALADLILGRQATTPNVEVVLTIDLSTWLGLNEHPGVLSGYGPITAETARELARDGSFRRLITDPLTGATLDLGASRYRPSAPLRRFIQARDKTCQFPGCQRPARYTDIDHRVEYDPATGGLTTVTNLQCLCRMHHNLKTRKLWHVDLHPDGSETWTSALGFTYLKKPGHRHLEPLEPPDDQDDLPASVGDVIPEHDPDPPYPVDIDIDLTPPPLTDEEYLEFYNTIENSFGTFADRAYDTLRNAGLIA